VVELLVKRRIGATGEIMAFHFLDRRKQRTRSHVIADLSVHFLEGHVLRAGHTVQRFERDYGYDLVMVTYNEIGFVEPGFLLIQLKASDSWQASGAEIVFDLDVRDYNLWTAEEVPVILVLFDASLKRAFWLPVQRYFRDNPHSQPRRGAKSVRVKVPTQSVVDRRAIEAMRRLKAKANLQIFGETK
jgi:hypothetical protein